MPDPSGPTGSRGKIITFYSYKGGTGRTMALANVAWILAANGYRVLAADWDLESPGLHRFFHPFLPNAEREGRGVVDMIRAYQLTAMRSDERSRKERHIADYARVEQYAFSLDWMFPLARPWTFFLRASRTWSMWRRSAPWTGMSSIRA